MANWPALMMASLLAVASALPLWWVLKERDAGTRFDIFSLVHPEGQTFPPFGWYDFFMPVLFGLGALGFLANFLGII